MAGPDKITILLADEDGPRSAVIAGLLRETPGMEVLAHCPDGEEAIVEGRRLKPNVAVVALHLAKVRGIDVVSRIRSEVQGTRVIIFSDANDGEVVREAVRAGADGYLLRKDLTRHLIDAISCVHEGGQYFSPQLRRDGADSPQPANPDLPELVEKAVAAHFSGMAARLQQRIEETQSQAVDGIIKNVQTGLVPRVSALEADVLRQAEAMNQLRECSQRIEETLGRVIRGVQELRLEVPPVLQALGSEPDDDEPGDHRKGSGRVVIRWVLIAAVLIAAIIGAVMWLRPASTAVASGNSTATESPLTKPAGLAADADANTSMQAARQYTEGKDYPAAESAYKKALKSDPGNVDALKGLASVLYREDKIEESATILGKLPPN